MAHKLFSTTAVGALAAAALVGAAGHMTFARAAEPGAVNPPAVGAAVAARAPASFADIVERVAPAVVSIDVESRGGPSNVAFEGADDDEDGSPFGPGQASPFGFDLRRLFPQQPQGEAPLRQGTGSGFFISADGYIVTNNHVVEGARKVTVRTHDERSLPARVVGRDPATDLAVIKVEGTRFPFVSFEETAKPRVGDWVIAVGNPFNLGGTATAGIVSAFGRSSGSSYVDYMQIDAPINRGNSGGPTFDVYGRVVGVNSAIYSPSGGSVGIGFDIPADVAASVARQLIAEGKVTRGYIGATVQSVTPEIAESLGVDGRKGALIAELTPGGPSAQAGLRPGDLVVRINGRDVQSSTDLTRQVALARPGDTIRLGVRRDGRVQDVIVRSGVRPAENQLTRAAYTAPQGSDDGVDGRVLGMALEPKTGGGVTIRGVASASDAGQKGLRQGDVILQAGGRKADSPADVEAAVAEARKAGRSSVLLQVARNGRPTFIPLKVGQAQG